MKNIILLTMLLLFTINSQAQLSDDMESYTDGAMIYTGHWTDWNGTGSTAIYASSAQAKSGFLSGYVPPNGTTDGLLNFGNKTIGQWGIKFWMYIPSGKEGYLNLQSNIPVTSGDTAVGDIYFNKDASSPGVGYVKYNSGVSSEWSYFNFPHDEWFEVIMNIHINNNWQLLINGNIEIDWEHYGRWVAAGEFQYTNSLGGLDFFSLSNNCEYWVDDFSFISGFQSSTVATTEFSEEIQVSVFPIPAKDILSIKQKDGTYNKLQITSILGEVLLEENIERNKTIDVSKFEEGIYLITFINNEKAISYIKKIIIK